jgi:hypothetical protein
MDREIDGLIAKHTALITQLDINIGLNKDLAVEFEKKKDSAKVRQPNIFFWC